MHHTLLRPLFRLAPFVFAACTGAALAASGTAGATATTGTATVAKPAVAPTPVNEEGMQAPKDFNAGYSSVNVPGPYIAMTFDDGPNPTLTPRLLDILAKRNIKVTFFVLGQCVQEHPEILKRAVAEGHEVGNHSWSHPAFSKMGDDAIRSQIERTQEMIKQSAGVTPAVLRPPYGAITARQKEWINKTFGLHVILWTVDPLDWKYRNAAHVESEILKQTRPGSIILSHDIHATTVDAMESTLDQLLAKGFKFVTVSQLLAMETPATPKNDGQTATSGTQTAKPAARKKRGRQ